MNGRVKENWRTRDIQNKVNLIYKYIKRYLQQTKKANMVLEWIFLCIQCDVFICNYVYKLNIRICQRK